MVITLSTIESLAASMDSLSGLLKKFQWNFTKRNSAKIDTKDNFEHVKPDAELLKSLKDRFNYASSTCSARILSTSPETISASAFLSSSKDSYLRFACSSNLKFVTVELCEEVKIDTIVLANYELFSSTVKDFKVYAASDNPQQQVIWKLILSGEMLHDGPFLHSDQAFPVPHAASDSFVKFLRIEFNDQHGEEDLCPVSVLKVYGKTMLDEFNEELKSKKGDNLPIFSEELVVSPELKVLIREMTEISSQISQEQENLSFHQNIVFNPVCYKREQVLMELEAKYKDLERKSFEIQAKTRTSGNVFKHLHERLNKLETSLKHPLNLILFRSRRHDDIGGNDGIPRLLAGQADKSVEELFSGLNDEISGLKVDFNRIQSDLSAQQSKITLLIAFNGLLSCILLISLLKKFFVKPANKPTPFPELRRRPLLELKSSSSSSTSINLPTSKSVTTLNSTPSPKPAPNTPGVVLSDDEVLLLDERICE